MKTVPVIIAPTLNLLRDFVIKKEKCCRFTGALTGADRPGTACLPWAAHRLEAITLGVGFLGRVLENCIITRDGGKLSFLLKEKISAGIDEEKDFFFVEEKLEN